jgi:SAM-dependent methyltransferase
MKASSKIHPSDLLFDYLRRVPFQGDTEKARAAYLDGGLDCARKFAGLCRDHSIGRSVLEFASGYGRVSRHVSKILPDKDWACCDIHGAAVAFLHETFGLKAFISTPDAGAWRAPDAYDAVFALSFFSHMPRCDFRPWLHALADALVPGGLLVFTTHGAVTMEHRREAGDAARFDVEGFYWDRNSDQGDLDPSQYGTSILTFDCAHQIIKSLPQLVLVRFQQAAWWGHQDLYIARRLPDLSLYRL